MDLPEVGSPLGGAGAGKGSPPSFDHELHELIAQAQACGPRALVNLRKERWPTSSALWTLGAIASERALDLSEGEAVPQSCGGGGSGGGGCVQWW